MSQIAYQELRGSISNISPITGERLRIASKGKTSYVRLAALLAEYGCSISNVIIDESRTYNNCFYEDYDAGLYFSIYLAVDDFSVPLRYILEKAKSEPVNQYLTNREWENFYFISVPLPLQSRDFQRRMYDMEPERVFRVWCTIYKRLDYPNGCWEPETLEYVFSHAPACPLPPLGDNGLVRVYRGMGSKSQPPETAISWSTDPSSALWFANHTGCGTHLISADIAPEQILAWYPGFVNENEVMVCPNTVQNISYGDLFSSVDFDLFLRLVTPMLQEFKEFCRAAPKLVFRSKADHGVRHALRVLSLSLLYYYHSGDQLNESDKRILTYFSLLHDIGRSNDEEDENHGDASVCWVREKGLRIAGLPLTKKEYRMADLLIRHHCREDSEGLAAIQSADRLSQAEKDHVAQLYKVCKDMDALDRVRFSSLNIRMLRTPFAARLPLFAGRMAIENLDEFIKHD